VEGPRGSEAAPVPSAFRRSAPPPERRRSTPPAERRRSGLRAARVPCLRNMMKAPPRTAAAPLTMRS